MSQQTPLARVEPIWREWMDRWPTPADLAAAAPGDAVRAWGRLGYPRRALRLHEAARAMVERHGGEVPDTPEALLALPGVGAYTAAAVSCFAFGIPEVVVDTNVRRVLARTREGKAFPNLTLNRAEAQLAADSMPVRPRRRRTRGTSPSWSSVPSSVWPGGPAATSARSLTSARGTSPADRPTTGPPRRGQTWHGTDRQVRGELLRRLRDAHAACPSRGSRTRPTTAAQVMRCLDSLVADGLVEPLSAQPVPPPLLTTASTVRAAGLACEGRRLAAPPVRGCRERTARRWR